MADEERTAVEETKAAEEEKAAEEAEVEEKAEVEESKAVEETKIEAKTDEKAKEGDALMLGHDGGSSGSEDSEISPGEQEAVKKGLPLELPLGCVLIFNVHHINDDYEGGFRDYAAGCIGLLDGNVLGFVKSSDGNVEYNEMIESYAQFVYTVLGDSVSNPTILEMSECGRSLPSKESTRFSMNLVFEGGGK